MAVLAWDSYSPMMLKRGLATSMIGGSLKDREIARMRGAMLKDAESDIERGERYDFAREREAEERATVSEEKKRAYQMADIEGESGMQRQVRLENQAWNPEKYGEKYRSQFKQQAQDANPAAEEEERRRRRMAMAGRMATSGAEDY